MSTTDLPGSSLLAGRYRLVERLGAGGMSVVWRGFDEVLGRQVAVKVLPPSSSADPSFRRRLRAEAQAAARLSHPNITNVYDYGEATTVDGEPVPYVVMELVDGESLAAVLARTRRLPWPAAVRICAEVSAALAAAHSRGIVHRDVTPANVMLTSAGAKVVDFGISALIGENDIDPDGSLLGTPAYLAPERLEGGQVSPATDVYAVGLLIYRTLIGQLPWDVGTTTALLRAHQYTEPEPLPPVDGLPPDVDALVARCLEKRPADRPSSAEVAHVLAGVSAGAPAANGYMSDWAGSGEDTTILPSQHSFTDGIGRVRPGHAKVAGATPSAAGRGVAAVPVSSVPVGASASAPAVGVAAPVEAPISPAPGRAVRVSVSEVEGAVYGSSPYAAPAAAPPPPPPPAAGAGNNGRAASAAPRNNRFGASAWAAPAAGAAGAAGIVGAAGMAPPVDPPPSAPAAAEPRAALGNGIADKADAGGPAGPGRNTRDDDYDEPRHGGRTAGARRVLIMAGTVVLLGVATYAWSLAATQNKSHYGALTTPEPSALVPVGKCVVSYTVWSATEKNFKASLTVANRDTVPLRDWKLWWIMPSGQVMTGTGTAKLVQQGGAITVAAPAKDVLKPQSSTTVQLSGRIGEQGNSAPMVFQLNKQTCDAYVSNKPGDPSRPVISDGANGQKLGPVPDKTNPPPGINIGSNGIVTPIPNDSSLSTGSTATTTATTTKPTTKPVPKPPSDDTSTPPVDNTHSDDPVVPIDPPTQPPPIAGGVE